MSRSSLGWQWFIDRQLFWMVTTRVYRYQRTSLHWTNFLGVHLRCSNHNINRLLTWQQCQFGGGCLICSIWVLQWSRHDHGTTWIDMYTLIGCENDTMFNWLPWEGGSDKRCWWGLFQWCTSTGPPCAVLSQYLASEIVGVSSISQHLQMWWLVGGPY